MTQPDYKHSIFARLDATIDQFEDTMKEVRNNESSTSDSTMRKANFILLQLRKEIYDVREEAQSTLTRLNTFGATLEIMANPEVEVDTLMVDITRWFMLLTQCERGLLSLYNKDKDVFQLAYDENWSDAELRPMEHTISEMVIKQVKKSKDILTSSNMDMADDSYQKSGSWRVPLRTVLGIPILWNDDLVGIFYGDKKITSGAVSQDMNPLFKLYGAQAAIAIRNAQRFAELSAK